MTHCCEQMRAHAEYDCSIHGQECPDRVITRTRNGDYVLPIYDGGGSGVEVRYCPWCGTMISNQVEDGIAAFEQLLQQTSAPGGERRVTFGRLIMSTAIFPGGSWVVTERHGSRLTTMIALDNTEARGLREQIDELLP